MTAEFDQIQEFLAHISTLEDPVLFATAIGYVKRIIASVHDIDHGLGDGNRIARGLDVTGAMKKIREFNKEIERRRKGWTDV